MLRIGKSPLNPSTTQQNRSQVTLGDLYQLYSQATRSPGQTVQLVWYTLSGDYTITAKSDPKVGAIWQLLQKGKHEAICRWTLTTANLPEVHKQMMLELN